MHFSGQLPVCSTRFAVSRLYSSGRLLCFFLIHLLNYNNCKSHIQPKIPPLVAGAKVLLAHLRRAILPTFDKKRNAMKTKITLLCLICISAITNVFANGTDPGPKAPAACQVVIEDFVNCHMSSDSKRLKQILNDDVLYKIPRGEKVLEQDKLKLVEQMKNEEGVQQNCRAQYEVLAASDALVIAKVDFTYGKCVQSNYVTLEKNAGTDWKITRVYKFFSDANTRGSTAPLAAGR